MGMRVEEDGESESHAVMAWIGIELRQYHPTRKRADLRLVFHHERVWQSDIRKQSE
ncbi:hypothetical protein ACFL6S_06010 [Candidatus Poribacteria bacterium]